MYYWRIWRETRARFFALLILGLVYLLAGIGYGEVWT